MTDRLNIRPLEEVIQYQNPDIIERFVKQFGVSTEDAHILFLETIKFLWVLATKKSEEGIAGTPAKINIYNQMIPLDEMWHTFILFTKDYTDFCQKNFGFYVHHFPSTNGEKERENNRQVANPETYLKTKKEEVSKQFEYIGSKLGSNTILRWIQDFPKRFPKLVEIN